MKRILIASCALVLLLAGAAWAQAPDTFLYQGRFTDANGAPLAPPVAVTFSLWNADAGGVSAWNSGELVLQAADIDGQGVFSVELGPVNTGIFDGAQRWLEIQITGEAPMTPRQLVSSVPYAVSAAEAGRADAVANNAINSVSIANNTVRNVDIVDEPGVGMTTAAASFELTGVFQTVASVTLAVPASGFVVVTGEAYAQPDFLADGWIQMVYQLSSSEAQQSDATYTTLDYDAGAWSYVPTTISTTYVFPVTAGSRTYSFSARITHSSGAMVSTLTTRRIIAVFYPTAYGAVSKSQETAEIRIPDGVVGRE